MGEMKIQLKLCFRLHLTLKLAIQYDHTEHNSVRMFLERNSTIKWKWKVQKSEWKQQQKSNKTAN